MAIPKIRCDVYIDANNYYQILNVMSKKGLQTISKTINSCINEFFKQETQQNTAITRLNELIGRKENEIQELKYQLRNKDLKKKEVKN